MIELPPIAQEPVRDSYDILFVVGQVAADAWNRTHDVSFTAGSESEDITPECDSKVVCPDSDLCSSEDGDRCSEIVQRQGILVA